MFHAFFKLIFSLFNCVIYEYYYYIKISIQQKFMCVAENLSAVNKYLNENSKYSVTIRSQAHELSTNTTS